MRFWVTIIEYSHRYVEEDGKTNRKNEWFFYLFFFLLLVSFRSVFATLCFLDSKITSKVSANRFLRLGKQPFSYLVHYHRTIPTSWFCNRKTFGFSEEYLLDSKKVKKKFFAVSSSFLFFGFWALVLFFFFFSAPSFSLGTYEKLRKALVDCANAIESKLSKTNSSRKHTTAEGEELLYDLLQHLENASNWTSSLSLSLSLMYFFLLVSCKYFAPFSWIEKIDAIAKKKKKRFARNSKAKKHNKTRLEQLIGLKLSSVEQSNLIHKNWVAYISFYHFPAFFRASWITLYTCEIKEKEKYYCQDQLRILKWKGAK